MKAWVDLATCFKQASQLKPKEKHYAVVSD